MKKKLIALLTAVTCTLPMLSLAGCGGKKSDHEFNILAVKENTVKDYNEMPVFKKLNEETGKDVHWTFQTSSQYSQNFDPVSTKDIDAIYHAGFSNLELYNYGKSPRNRIVAIDQYLDSMPNFKRILDSRPDIKEALKSPDGHIYSLPRIEEMGLKQYPNILFINKAWISKLIKDNNLPNGVTLTEEDLKDGLDLSRAQFKALLQKFNSVDMDGDGKAGNAGGDEIPLAYVGGNWQGNESDLVASFGVPENNEHKTIVNGKVKFTIEDEKWFNAYKELNGWYKEGLIRSTNYTRDQDEFLAYGQSGRYGAFYWWEKETVVNKSLYDNYVIVLPLKDDDGKRYVGVSNELEVEKSVCVILSSCKDKAGLLSYFDKFFEPDYSAQINYGSIESGAFLEQKQDGMLIPNDDHGSQSADDFRMQNAPYGVVYLTDEVWNKTVKMESRASLRLERLEEFVKPYTFTGATSIPNLNYTEQQLKDLSTYEMSLGGNISTQMMTWLRSDSTPQKSEWTKFLSDNQTSIDMIKQINQAAYDNYLEVLGKN
ncbi:MAG: hypothetical protein J1G04_01865 [Clostridiales bacterium]|nr:hypothetical protein [Clostridiales bacterium]